MSSLVEPLSWQVHIAESTCEQTSEFEPQLIEFRIFDECSVSCDLQTPCSKEGPDRCLFHLHRLAEFFERESILTFRQVGARATNLVGLIFGFDGEFPLTCSIPWGLGGFFRLVLEPLVRGCLMPA